MGDFSYIYYEKGFKKNISQAHISHKCVFLFFFVFLDLDLDFIHIYICMKRLENSWGEGKRAGYVS